MLQILAQSFLTAARRGAEGDPYERRVGPVRRRAQRHAPLIEVKK